MTDPNKTLCAADLTRLQRFCGMFSSDHLGELATAAAMADKFLRDHGLRWTDIRVTDTESETLNRLQCQLEHSERWVVELAKRNARLQAELEQLRQSEFAEWGGWQAAAQFCLRHELLLTDSQKGYWSWTLTHPPSNGLTSKQRQMLQSLLNKLGHKRR